jgi:hypothetical protein
VVICGGNSRRPEVILVKLIAVICYFRISSKARRGKKRRAVTISVSMSVPSQDAFGPENYSEIRDITLDGKKKLLAFHDYSHTEYW